MRIEIARANHLAPRLEDHDRWGTWITHPVQTRIAKTDFDLFFRCSILSFLPNSPLFCLLALTLPPLRQKLECRENHTPHRWSSRPSVKSTPIPSLHFMEEGAMLNVLVVRFSHLPTYKSDSQPWNSSFRLHLNAVQQFLRRFLLISGTTTIHLMILVREQTYKSMAYARRPSSFVA